MDLRSYRYLRWAVQEASAWRGHFTGLANPDPLERFDEKITGARKALKVARNDIKKIARRPNKRRTKDVL